MYFLNFIIIVYNVSRQAYGGQRTTVGFVLRPTVGSVDQNSGYQTNTLTT